MRMIKEIAKKRNRILNEIKILTDIEDVRDLTGDEPRRMSDLSFTLVNLDLELKEIQELMTKGELSKCRTFFSLAACFLFGNEDV